MPPISELTRIEPVHLDRLDHQGIFTTGLLLEVSETPSRRQTLADQVGADTTDVGEWRDEALMLNLASSARRSTSCFIQSGIEGLRDILDLDLDEFRVRIHKGVHQLARSSTYQVFERGQLAGRRVRIPGWWQSAISSLNARASRQPQSIKATCRPMMRRCSSHPIRACRIRTRSTIVGEKYLEVNLSEQYMTVWAGNEVVLGTYVSTGREGFDTPTGTFFINTMLESQTMEGVLGGEYYNVPDVPWVMYFTDAGHAIHGTYWHSNFGQVMSHGCVNLPMDVAEWLYNNFAFVGIAIR